MNLKDTIFLLRQNDFGEAADMLADQDEWLARAADALNARPYNDDMVLGAAITDFRAKSQQ